LNSQKSLTIWQVGFVFLIAILLTLISGRCGFFAGDMPSDLGVRDGRLKPPSLTPNSVSSQAFLYPDHPQKAYSDFTAWQFSAPGSDVQAVMFRQVVQEASTLSGALLIRSTPTYAHFAMHTPVLGFVDDLELWMDSDHSMVHIRSASRIGQYDFGKNRERAEELANKLASRSSIPATNSVAP
jgi:uncharacterized protein (DUF1499 family)